MADEGDVSKIVTTFLLNTCRLLPGISRRDVESVVLCSVIATMDPLQDEAEHIPLTTGSVAEFYIEPMLPHVGDVDVMYYYNNMLAIPPGRPPPTQLPAEFHNYVKVAEIIDSHLPGYVYLPLRYLLTQCIDDDYFEYDKRAYLSYNSNGRYHGPAGFTYFSEPSRLSLDSVCCVRCLSWPPQAADWPTPHRNYGWPDSAIRDNVLSNGCDVVGVAHHQCRQHGWAKVSLDYHSHEQKLY